jgi:hypothetical protein
MTHIKSCFRYFLEVPTDDTGVCSVASQIEKARCELPVESCRGWKYVRLDLLDLTQRAFGTR